MKKNEVPTLEIFNVQIFGDDALEFLSWTQEMQKEWILTMTNQTNESVIYEFLSNPKLSEKAGCSNCGPLNNIIFHSYSKDRDSFHFTKQYIEKIEENPEFFSEENTNKIIKEVEDEYNISKGNAEENADSSEPILARESSGRDNRKRQKVAKRNKN